MIRILAKVACDYSLLDNRDLLPAWPHMPILMGAKMARLMGRPLTGWLVLHTERVWGWVTVSCIPDGCTVVGGYGTYRQALGIAQEVILIVDTGVAGKGVRVLDLKGYTEVERRVLDTGLVFVRLELCK